MKFIVDIDLEDNGFFDFFWDEDKDQPPIVKGKVRKRKDWSGDKDERMKN